MTSVSGSWPIVEPASDDPIDRFEAVLRSGFEKPPGPIRSVRIEFPQNRFAVWHVRVMTEYELGWDPDLDAAKLDQFERWVESLGR